MRFWSLPSVLLSLCGWLTGALPPGFIDEGVARVTDGTGSAVMPSLTNSGKTMIVVAQKRGLLYAVEDPDETDRTFLMLDITNRVCAGGERGLGGVAVHPNFEQNRWLYLFYTYDNTGACLRDAENGPRNRLSRVKVRSDNHRVQLSTEEVLLETVPLEFETHNGGAMLFGSDGYLYVTLGDGGDRNDFFSQKKDTLLGKILRITDDGQVPGNNPFVGDDNAVSCHEAGAAPTSDGVCTEIFAIGLRNPFRFAMDMNHRNQVRFFVSDVGGSKWEEIDEGGTNYAGTNYGWPTREGPCRLASFDDCSPLSGDFEDPLYWYAHNEDGAAVLGGTFVPEDSGWPQEFRDSFLFNEFVHGKILWLRKDATRYCRYCSPPISEWYNTTFHDWPRPVDLFFAPYGSEGEKALYYVARSGRVNIRRIRYIGGADHPPVAVATADVIQGNEPLTVQFDASESSDPDGDEILYHWDFGEGTTSTEASPQFTFENPGLYEVELIVTDDSSFGFSDKAFVEIQVGTPPVAIIDSPPEGQNFAVGDIFTLSGRVQDIDGNPMDDAVIYWEVRQHHNTHYHPYLGKTEGNNFSFQPAPPPEDFLAATNSYLEVIMYGYGTNGLVSIVSRNIIPKAVSLLFDSEPSGLEVFLDDYPVRLPAEVVSWENHRLRVGVEDQGHYTFESWSDGGSRSHEILVSSELEQDVPFVARFNVETDLSSFYGCFSGHTVVTVKKKGRVKMENLRLGDEILVDHAGRYEKVYAFAHRSEGGKANFLQILPSNLEISIDHMVFVQENRAIPASLLQVGDRLSNGQVVEEIRAVSRTGVYAPFTPNGALIVNGVMASAYVSFQDSPVVKMGSWNTPVTYQWLAHGFVTPCRIWFHWLGAEPSLDDNGMSMWLDKQFGFALWFLRLNPVAMGIMLIPLVSICFVFVTVERYGVAALAFLFSILYYMQRTRRMIKK